MSYVTEASPEETSQILRKMGLPAQQAVNPGMFGKLKGFVDAVCRNEDGSTAWEIHQPNIVTDLALRKFYHGFHSSMNTGLNTNLQLVVSPNTELPIPGRYTLPDDGTSGATYNSNNGWNLDSSGGTMSFDLGGLTWYYSYVFTGANRRVGTIGLCGNSQNTLQYGTPPLYAYTLLSPWKTQTSLQTVEVSYRLTLSLIY